MRSKYHNPFSFISIEKPTHHPSPSPLFCRSAFAEATARLPFLVPFLFDLEHQALTAGGDFDPVAGFELAFEQFHGERIQQLLLHGAFERTHAVIGPPAREWRLDASGRLAEAARALR